MEENELMELCRRAALDIRATEIIFRRSFFYTFCRYSSYRELAKHFGISPNRVFQIEREARRKLNSLVEPIIAIRKGKNGNLSLQSTPQQ